MDKGYTPEIVEDMATAAIIPIGSPIASMLRAYAATLRQQAQPVARVDEEFDLRKYVRHMADVLEAGVGLLTVDSDLARLGAAIQAALAQNTQGEDAVDPTDPGHYPA